MLAEVRSPDRGARSLELERTVEEETLGVGVGCTTARRLRPTLDTETASSSSSSRLGAVA